MNATDRDVLIANERIGDLHREAESWRLAGEARGPGVASGRGRREIPRRFGRLFALLTGGRFTKSRVPGL